MNNPDPNAAPAGQQPNNAEALDLLLTPYAAEIDLRSESGRKMWMEMSKGFMSDEEKYDGSKLKVHAFLRELKRYVDTYSMEQVLTIDSRNGPKNLLQQYGEISIDQVIAKADLVWTEPARFQERIRHNALGSATWKSISNSAKLQISGDAAKYERTGGIDGPSLIKTLLRYTTTGTRGSVFNVKQKLNTLTLKQFDHDIEKANRFVNQLMLELRSAGARHEDLVFNLLSLNSQSHCREFTMHIEIEYKSKYDKGEDILPEDLMSGALEKFVALRDQKTWVKEDETQKQILALVAAFKNTSKQNKQTPKVDGNKKDDSKESVKGSRPDRPIAPWKLVVPAAGAKLEKTVDGKTYYWCPKHHEKGMWTRHKASQCKRNESNADDSKKSTQYESKTKLADKKNIQPNDELGKAFQSVTNGKRSFLAQAYAAATSSAADSDEE